MDVVVDCDARQVLGQCIGPSGNALGFLLGRCLVLLCRATALMHLPTTGYRVGIQHSAVPLVVSVANQKNGVNATLRTVQGHEPVFVRLGDSSVKHKGETDNKYSELHSISPRNCCMDVSK